MKLPTRQSKARETKIDGNRRNPVQHDETPPVGVILREKELDAETGTRRVTRWRWRKQGLFPRPIRLGPNSIGYLRSEIEEWLRQRERV